MADDKTILSFEIDFGDSSEKFDSLASAGTRLRDVMSDIKRTSKSLGSEVTEQLTDSSNSVDRTLDHMAAIDRQMRSGKLDSYQLSVKTDEFANLSKSLSAIIADMKTVQQLSASIGKQTTSYTQKQMHAMMPQLMNIAREATAVYKQTGNLASDEQLLGAIKTSSRFKDIRSSLLGTSGKGAGAIDDILRLAIIKGVGQVQRGTFMSKLSSGNSLEKHVFSSFSDMLPSGFQKINSMKGPTVAQVTAEMKKAATTALTGKEYGALYSLIQSNQFAAEAAEKINIASRKNGKIYLQKGISRGMVNAMGSQLYDHIVNSAKGMQMYGIDNVNDADSWDRIARKSNKRFLGGMAAARRMNDAFKWFEAERYRAPDYSSIYKATMDANTKGKHLMDNRGRNINFSPNPNSYEVALYTLDDLKQNRNWNDRMNFRSSKYTNYRDYHHITADESLHLNTIMRNSKKGVRPHNSYLDDVIYLEVDPRLGDEQLDPGERERLIKEYADVFQHGISGMNKNDKNERYVLSRINPKMGAEFIRESVFKKIKNSDPTYFSAGLGQTDFDDWSKYAAAMEYRNKNATPGQDIRKLFGSELPQNIVVVDLKNQTKGEKGSGLDGASVISNRIVKQGFQGRAHGIKSALSAVDIEKLVDAYGGELYLSSYTGSESEKEALLDAEGKAILDDKGKEVKVGRRIKVGKDVDMIINAADLKNADARFAGMTNEQITAEVKKDLAKGIYANRLYSDANGKTRWLSGQLAQILDITPKETQIFAQSFMEHYRKVGDYDYAMQHLFNGEDETHDLLVKHPEAFGSKAIQNRISDYRQSIMARMLRGDLMLPNDTNAYKAMVTPWLVDAFNADMMTKHNGEAATAFANLPSAVQDRLSSLTLGEDKVLFQKTLASMLGLARYPATARSIKNMTNVGADSPIAKFAKEIGLDPYGLYVSTASPLLQLLQDADFDGDVLEIIELATKSEKGADIDTIMKRIVESTAARNEALYQSGGISKEELAKRDQSLKRIRNHGTKFSTKFDTELGARSAAEWLAANALQSAAMGTPNATVRNAFQMNPDSVVARALVDADRQYSKNSVEGKKGEGRNTSQDQMDVIGKFKPFSEFYRMVDKSRDEYGHIIPSELREKNFFGVNLPSATMSGSMRYQNLARFLAKNKFGYDINEGYDWNQIFEIAHGELNPESAVGRMQMGLKDVLLGVINADYLAPSDQMAAQLLRLKSRALEEEAQKVAIERQQGLLKGKDLRRKDEAIAASRIGKYGGNVIDNLVAYALTESDTLLGENKEMIGALQAFGIDNVIGNLDLSKYISGDIKSVSALREEAKAERLARRGDAVNALAGFTREQREAAIDNLNLSPSLLTKLMKDPVGWMAHYLAGKDSDEMTPYTHLGLAAHEAIEGFMKKRGDAATAGGILSPEELNVAAKEAVTGFEEYLKNSVGKQGLSQTDYDRLKGSKAYKGIMKYLSNDLVNLYPENEYEVAGIEQLLKFDLGKKVGVNQNGEHEDVKTEGHFDLLFRNRKTGNYIISDMKNYPNPTAFDQSMFTMQTQLYGSAIGPYLKNGGSLEGISIIKPIQGLVEQVNASPDAIARTLENAKTTVGLIQGLVTSGFAPEQVMAVSKLATEMFAGNASTSTGIAQEIEKAIEQEISRTQHIQSQMTSDQASENMSAALIMHDKYNKSMQTLNGINSFVWKSDADHRDLHTNMWAQNYSQLDMQKGVVRDLRNSKMDIQADMLEAEMDRTRAGLDELLPRSAVTNLQEAYDLLHGINTEEIATKGAKTKVDEFKAITKNVTAAADAYDVLDSKIQQNAEQIKEKKELLKTETDEEKKIALGNEIGALEVQNRETYIPKLKEAKAIKEKLDAEFSDYLKNNNAEVWNELNSRSEMLHGILSGERATNLNTIADDLKSYVNAVKQTKGDAELYAKTFGIDTESQQYKDYINGLNELITQDAQKKRMADLAATSFTQFEGRKGSIAGNVLGMAISSDEQIENMVRVQAERIAQEKANIAKRYKGYNLSDEEQARYDALMGYYNSFSEEEYRKQLQESREQARARENLQLSQFIRQGSQMQRHMFGRRGGFFGRALDVRDANLSQWENRKQQLDTLIDKKEKEVESLKNSGKGVGDAKYDAAVSNLMELKDASTEAGRAIEMLTDPMATAMAVTSQFGDVVGRLAQRLGYRLFRRVLQETKRFVKEFDASMNEIQAITLKSDGEMQTVRSDTVSKALGLRTSVSNVANVEAALYRQGLSDEEVSSRTNSIIKFATVTKLNVGEATKIITTALQNDLVNSATAAMDALVALGDNAATTAAEIGKGMQKAAAAAKVAGVSYAELTALLTIGTSDTQLSGTQVGTALQTVFTRMRRLSLNKYVADQNGTKTTASEAEAALKTVGVELWDDKTTGKMRTAYEVLLDLSKVWQDLSDAQKNIVMGAMAGTRQTNVFATLMEGMSEDEGATLEKYLGLSENSEGITQTKYEIAMQSLAAAMDEMKASFDAVVESFTNNGIITGVLDGISGFLQTVANAGPIGQGFGIIAGGIAAVATALMLLKTANPAIGAISLLLTTVAGLAAAGGVSSLFGGIASLFHVETNEEKAKKELEKITNLQSERQNNINEKQSAIDKVEKYGEAFNKLKDAQDSVAKSDASRDLIGALNDLAAAFPNLNKPIEDSINDLDKWTEAIKAAKEQIEGLKENDERATVQETVSYITNNASWMFEGERQKYEEKRNMLTRTDRENIEAGLMLSGYDLSGWSGRSETRPSVEEYAGIFNSFFTDSAAGEDARSSFINFIKKSGIDYADLWGPALEQQDQASIWDYLSGGNGPTDAFKVAVIQELIDQMANSTELSLGELQKIAVDTMEKSIMPGIPFEELATEKYSSDYLKKAFLNAFKKELGKSNSGYNFFDEDGNLSGDVVASFFATLFSNKGESGVNDTVERNLQQSDYPYSISLSGRRGHAGYVGFTSLDAAKDYATEFGIDFGRIKKTNGESAVTSAEKALEALRITKNENKEAQVLSTAIDKIQNASSLSELYAAYDEKGLGQELANAIGSSPELLGAYVQTANGKLSFDEFKKIAKEANVGRGSYSGFATSVYSLLTQGDLSVNALRTSKELEGVYSAFKSVVGDSADALLNAIEDGIYDANSDLGKTFSKSIVEARIKEATQFKQGSSEAMSYVLTSLFGSGSERRGLATSEFSTFTELYNYRAAVERYRNGTATDNDYSLIASKNGLVTENQLRNGNQEAVVAKGLQAYENELIEAQNLRAEQFMAGYGLLTLDEDVLKNTTATKAQQAEYLERKGLSKNKDAQSSIGQLSQWEYLKGVGALDAYGNFYDPDRYIYENGKVVGIKAGNEDLLSASAFLKRYDNKYHDYYRKYNQKQITDAELSELYAYDDRLARMAEAGAPEQTLLNYAARQYKGKQGSFADNYNWVATMLLGSDWQDVSKWRVNKNSYINSGGTQLRTFYDEMISQMPDAEALKKYISGETESLPEDYAQKYVEWLQNIALEGTRDAAEIATNRAILGTGRDRDRFSLLAGFQSGGINAQNAQYYLNNWTSESAGVLASYLGIDESVVQGKSKEELQEALNDQVKDMIIKQAKSYGAELTGITDASSMSDLKDALGTALEGAEGEARNWIQGLIDLFDESGNLIASKNELTPEQVFNKSYESLEQGTYLNKAIAFLMNNSASLVPGGNIGATIGGIKGWDNRWNEAFFGNQGIAAALSMFQNGNLSQADLFSFLNTQATGAGKNYDYYSMLMSGVFGSNFQNGQLSLPGALDRSTLTPEQANWLSELEGKFGDSLTEALDDNSDAMSRFNEQFSDQYIDDQTKYWKNASQASQILKGLSKGGKEGAQAIATLRKEAAQLNNAAIAIKASKGKSGAELSANQRSDLAAVTGEDAELIKQMTKDEIASLAQRAQESIDESFVEDFAKPIQETLQERIRENPIAFELATKLSADGAIDTADIAAIAARIGDDTLAQMASQAGTIGELILKLEAGDDRLKASLELVRGAVTGAGKRMGGGGGGGGKSEIDKLLEEQKRKVAEIEHQSKMVEIQQKHYDFVGDYESYNDTVGQEIDLQEQLRSTYTNNLAELQKMMKSVKEGSDDWKKLRDAVMQAEEALLSINNTIDELNGKYITSEQSKQEKTDKVQNHALTMLQKRAAGYQTQGRFEAYKTETLKTLDTIRTQIDTNNEQIKSWESVLATMKEGDKNWEETRDKIWAIQEENAELENQLASDMISLQEAQAAQIAHDLENENASYEHANNIFETYAGMAESIGDYESYRSFLAGTNANNSTMRDQTADAIVELKKQIESMDENDPARESAISTLYQLEESVAKYEASILSNRQAIEESYITEVTENASKAMRSMEHEFEMLEEAEKEFVRNDDFVNQENIMFEKARNVSDRIAEQREILEGYYELQASGKIAEGSKQWDALQDSIYATEKTIASLTNDYQGFIDKAQTLRFDNLVQDFGDLDDQLTHNLKMIQYEETRYQNKGELTNYGSMLEMDTSIQRERAANIRNHIEDLKAQQDEAKNYPELYDKITKEIYKWEEALSQTNNTIEKNEDLLKKNEEAIRKAKQAVENIVDKEIRTRIQKERDMLSATVSIENTIVDVIRKRYQSEWELEQKTLDKKKQALNEEKNLINERLNAKKKAMDQEDKYEELAEYRRQLTLISADPTRTKEATELRSKIKELQRELSWTVAEDEANALLEGIDDQIKAIDEYVTTYGEDLSEMLSDANNFKDDLAEIMGGSFEKFLAYMKENSEDYKKATDKTRAQMEQGWQDTWITMTGELKKYWDEVDETMRSKEGFLAYMMNSDSYLGASASGQESMLQSWSDIYDAYTASMVDNASYEHSHEILSKIDELKDWTFNVQLVNPEGYAFNPLYSSYMYNRDRTGAEDFDPYNLYTGVGLQPEPEPVSTPSGGGSGGGSTDSKTYSRRVYYTYGSGSISEVIGRGKTPEEALKNAYSLVPKTAHHADANKEALQKWINSSNPTVPSVAEETKSTWSEIVNKLSHAFVPTVSPAAEALKAGASTVNIGDVNVNVSTNFDSDQDYDKLAERVGSAIMNAVEKQGIKLANYTI